MLQGTAGPSSFLALSLGLPKSDEIQVSSLALSLVPSSNLKETPASSTNVLSQLYGPSIEDRLGRNCSSKSGYSFWSWEYQKKDSGFLMQLSQLDPLRRRYVVEAVGFIVFLAANFSGKALTPPMRLIMYETWIGLGDVRLNLPILGKVVESCLEYSGPSGVEQRYSKLSSNITVAKQHIQSLHKVVHQMEGELEGLKGVGRF